MPRKTHGKQSNWRAGDADPDETRRETGAARSVNVCERDAGTELGTHHDVGIATGRQK